MPERLRRRVLRIGGTALATWGLLALAATALPGCLTRAFLHPDRHVRRTPADVDLAFQPIRLSAEDGTGLSGWFVPATQPRATAILLHGNGGNVADCLAWIRLLHGARVSVLAVDYRGYGASEGSPDAARLVSDGRAMLRYARSRADVAPDRVGLMGLSLGTAVALGVAGRAADLRFVLLEGTLDPVTELARRFPGPLLPLRLLHQIALPDDLDTRTSIRRVEVPILFVHGAGDGVTSLAGATHIAALHPGAHETWILPDGEHLDAPWRDPEGYTQRLNGLLDRAGL